MPADDYANSLVDTTLPVGVLTPGAVLNGEIGLNADKDWFKAELAAGGIYRFTLADAASAFFPPYSTFELRDAAGTFVDNVTNYRPRTTTSSFTLSPDTDATYHVVAGGNVYVGAWSYRIGLERIGTDDYADGLADAGSPIGSIALGGSITGGIDVGRDRDWHAVDLAAGATYLLTIKGALSGGGTLPQPLLTVHDAAGAAVTSTTAVTTWFSPAVSGRYYLDAAGYADYYTGTYTLAISEIRADAFHDSGLGDAYFVDTPADTILESPSGGLDSVDAVVDYTLPAHVENLTLLESSLATRGYGNPSGNTLTGNAAGNDLAGGLGNDTISGGGGPDRLRGGVGDDLLLGGTGDDRLYGGAGDDVMRGGGGDDVYEVQSAGDQVIEDGFPDGGIDTVRSTMDYLLPGNIEKLILDGSAVHGTGNELDNVLKGNAADNVLTGEAGNDLLSGFAGNDTLDGGAGHDELTGGTGHDAFVFRAGETDGDALVDFDGAGAAAGDSLVFSGFGPGATLTLVDASHWRISYGPGLADHETITVSNGASIHPSDYTFI